MNHICDTQVDSTSVCNASDPTEILAESTSVEMIGQERLGYACSMSEISLVFPRRFCFRQNMIIRKSSKAP